jgi:hypothetical protein
MLAPQTMRMELAKHFVPILCANNAYGYPHNHVHIAVIMDKAVCSPRDEWNNVVAARSQMRKLESIAAVPAAAVGPPSSSPGDHAVHETRIPVPGTHGDENVEGDSPPCKQHPKIKPQLDHNLSAELKKVTDPVDEQKVVPSAAYLPVKSHDFAKEKSPPIHPVNPLTNRSVSLSDFVLLALNKKGKQGRLLK